MTTLLEPGGLVIDAGAHKCEFGEEITRTYASQVIALEPNTDLHASPGATHENVRLLHAALGAQDGEATFFQDANAEAGTIVAGQSEVPIGATKVDVRSLKSVVHDAGADIIDLVKLDVEFAEFDVLNALDPDLAARIKQITVEFHPLDAKGAELDRIKDTIRTMEQHGFHTLKASTRGYGDVLFVNGRFIERPSYFTRLATPLLRKAREKGAIQ